MEPRIIWASPITETAEGYVVSFAALLGDIRIGDKPAAVGRIKYKGKLLYTTSEPNGKLADYFTFYDGRQIEPDPTMNEALEGNAPIYPWYSYVVFKDVPLTFFDNEFPRALEIDPEYWRDAGHLQAISIASSSAE